MVLEDDKRTLCDKPQQARQQEKGLCPAGRQQAEGASICIDAPSANRICSVCKDRRQRAAVFFPQYCLIGESHVLCAVAHLDIPLDELARRRIVEHFARCRVTRIVNDINLTFAVYVHLLRLLSPVMAMSVSAPVFRS